MRYMYHRHGCKMIQPQQCGYFGQLSVDYYVLFLNDRAMNDFHLIKLPSSEIIFPLLSLDLKDF